MYRKILALITICFSLSFFSYGQELIKEPYSLVPIRGAKVSAYRIDGRYGFVLLESHLPIVEKATYTDVEIPVRSSDNNEMIMVCRGNRWGAYDAVMLEEAIPCLFGLETARKLAIRQSIKRDKEMGRTWKKVVLVDAEQKDWQITN